jgi:hypothetical protein
MEVWNQAAMVKHLWNLCFTPGHAIWSSWIHTCCEVGVFGRCRVLATVLRVGGRFLVSIVSLVDLSLYR